MKVVLLLLTSLNFLSFLWSVIGVFRKFNDLDHGKYLLLRISTLITWGVCLFAFRKDSTELSYLIGAVFQTVCLAVFWFHARIVKSEGFSIVYSKDIPTKIVKRGFYRWLRHPFYTTYLVSYFSVALVFEDIASLICAIVMACFYFDAARMEERKFVLSNLQNEFFRYKKETWMFFPKVTSSKSEGQDAEKVAP